MKRFLNAGPNIFHRSKLSIHLCRDFPRLTRLRPILRYTLFFMMFGTQNLDQGCKIVSFRVRMIKFFIFSFFGIFWPIFGQISEIFENLIFRQRSKLFKFRKKRLLRLTEVYHILENWKLAQKSGLPPYHLNLKKNNEQLLKANSDY